MHYDTIIRNGSIVLDSGVEITSIGILDGKIHTIARHIEGTASHEWDAAGHYIFPGMIDIHVHFSEPGRTHWEGFTSGSLMMAAGGCTTYFDMPLNGIPSTVFTEALYEKARLGEEQSCVDFGLWGGLVPGNEDDLEPLAKAGVVGFKAFLSPTGTAEFEAVDDETLLRGMTKIAELGKVLALHAEDPAIVEWLRKEKQAAGKVSADDYLASRPIAAEVEAVRRALAFAEITGCPLHFVHISSAAAVDMIQAAKKRGMNVTLETCAHYLMFNHDALRERGAVAKCAPPLREKLEQEKLIELVLADQVDMITSDHSPCPPEMKQQEQIDMFTIWGGISGGQFSLLSMLELAKKHSIPFEKIALWTAKAPAQRFGLHPQKGEIMVGADADFAVVSFDKPYTVTPESFHAKHKQSLYMNHTFPCTITKTFNRGVCVYEEGAVSAPPAGTWLVCTEQPIHS